MSGVTVASLQVEIGADTKGLDAGLSSATSKVEGFGSKLSSVGGAVAGLAAGAAVAGVAALAAGFTGAVGAAASFEQQLSAISAVSGATGEEMATLKGLALDLGKSTSFSASEAANGIEELVKAGVSIEDVMGGAASASLSLAAAGAIGVGEAAAIASNAMNAFSLKGEDLGHVADVIAGAANASAISVNDFKFSLAAVGSVASAAGLGFDDTAVAIAELGQAGIKGSDAGTSLKSFIAGLTPSSKSATTAMKELGLITADGANQFFTAEGKMKSMAEIQQLLQDSTKDLTAEQKLMKLETIFGSDAIRAAAVLAKEGSEGYDKMAGSMSKVTAEMVATERLNNRAGSWEQLKGSVETLAITFGMAFLPMLKGAADGVTGFINTLIPLAEEWAPVIAETMVGIATQVGQVFETVMPVVSGLFSSLMESLPTVVSLVQGFFALFSGDASFGQIIGLAGLLTSIFGPDMTGLIMDFTVIAGDAFREVAATALDLMGGVVDWFQTNWPLMQQVVAQVLAGLVVLWETHGANILTVIESVWTIVKTVVGTALSNLGDLIRIAMQVITGDFSGAWDTFTGMLSRNAEAWGTIIGAAWDGILAIVDIGTGGAVTATSNWLTDTTSRIESGMGVMGDAISSAWDGIVTIHEVMAEAIVTLLGAAWDSIKSAAQGAWDGFKSLISDALDGIKTAISTVWNRIPEDIRTDLTTIANHLVTKGGEWVTNLTTAGSNMLSAITGKLGEMVDAATTWATSTFLAPIQGLVTSASSTATEVGGGMLSSISGKLGEIVTAATTWAGTFLAPITGLVTTATAAAASVASGIWTAITTKLGEIVGFVTTWGGSIVSAISGLVGAVGSAAASIGQGIIDAITGAVSRGAGAVTSSLLGMARAGLQAVKDELGIHSPSEQWWKEVGQPIGQGVIGGLLSTAPAFLAATQTIFRPPAALVGQTLSSMGQQAMAMAEAARQAAMAASRARSLPEITTVLDQLGKTIGQNINTIRQFGQLASGSIIPGYGNSGALGQSVGMGPGTYQPHADGGWLTEPVVGRGLWSGDVHSFAERGPEYIAPAGQMVGGGGGVNLTVNVNVYGNALASREEVADAVMQALQYGRRSGRFGPGTGRELLYV